MRRERLFIRGVGAGLAGAVPIAALGAALAWGTAGLAAPTTSPPDVEAAVVVAAWWVLVATLTWLTASVFVLRAAEASARSLRVTRFAMPGSRSIARSMLAVGMLTVSACSSNGDPAPRLYAVDGPVESDESPTDTAALSEEASAVVPTTPELVEPVEPVETTTPVPFSPRNEPPPLEMGVDPHPLLVPVPTDQVETDVERSEPMTHTVERGDNLWTIAAAHLEQATGSTPTNAEIAGYWRLVIAENEAGLASGEPNVILPGEIISLPDAA